jgi:hypothetical protein
MHGFQSFDVLGFHSCDRELGLRVINGTNDLTPSDNTWDWLGSGIYFWESDPAHALEYAIDTASGKLKNKKAPETPFVIGSVIQLGNCLNLIEVTALDILGAAYESLEKLVKASGGEMPVNRGKNRALDYAVINFIHEGNHKAGKPPYDTIRCAFPEGDAAYPGAMISKRLHIQICVCNPEMIKGYFLPKPVKVYNPNL